MIPAAPQLLMRLELQQVEPRKRAPKKKVAKKRRTA